MNILENPAPLQSGWLTRLLAFGRQNLPLSARARLRGWMFASMDLTWRARSGVRLRIEKYADWTIYNEIFVDGDYDEGIALALKNSPHPRLHVVDLGANAGFFTLRALDRLVEHGFARESLSVTAIEADPSLSSVYESRVLLENNLGGNVHLATGLAGRRTGTGRLIRDCATLGQERHPLQVPFLDLSTVLSSVECIDLLKCDIEGAEQDVIESYPDLFAKTRVVVFEFHPRHCNVDVCRALLREYGFTHEAARRPDSEYPLCTFWR